VFIWMLAPHFLVEFLLSGTIDKSYVSLAVNIVNSAPIKGEIDPKLPGDSFLLGEIGKICQLRYHWKCFGELI
jgi:hypothetical protein